MLAFKAGIAVSADLSEWGFDTHTNNDTDQSLLLANVTDGIDYLWTTADQLGLADRIVLVMGSDFGRTPHYNAGDGKDHWPIGSYVIMERNASYTNRVFGDTDGGHNAYPVNLITGKQDSLNGAPIYPKDVHQALRRYLGIAGSSFANQFQFAGTTDFAMFV